MPLRPRLIILLFLAAVAIGLAFVIRMQWLVATADARLMDAVVRRDLAAAAKAVEWGADINHVHQTTRDVLTSETVLMRAAWKDAPEVVRWLIDLGADLEAFNLCGMTALAAAVESGNIESARVLLETGAVVDATYTDPGGIPTYPLLRAIEHGDMAMAGLLLDHGSDANLLSFYAGGPATLEAALRRSLPEIVERLLAAGAPVAGIDLSWGRAIDLSLSTGDESCLRLILEAERDRSRRDVLGMTILMRLVRNAYPPGSGFTGPQPGLIGLEPVERLVQAGADLAARDDAGMTALMHAVESGSIEMIRLLVESGADVTAVDDAGNTAADFARGRRWKDTEQVMRVLEAESE